MSIFSFSARAKSKPDVLASLATQMDGATLALPASSVSAIAAILIDSLGDPTGGQLMVTVAGMTYDPENGSMGTGCNISATLVP